MPEMPAAIRHARQMTADRQATPVIRTLARQSAGTPAKGGMRKRTGWAESRMNIGEISSAA